MDGRRARSRTRSLFILAVVLFLASLVVGSAKADESSPLSVPAEFVRELGLPGSANHFLRPSAIYIDPNQDEIFIADPGHNRIVILDSEGTFRFEFYGDEQFGMPLDVVTDSDGYLYVLGSTEFGRRILRYDFDGWFLGELPITPEFDGVALDIRRLAIDSKDRLYALDAGGMRVLRIGRDGGVELTIPLVASLDDELRADQIFGAIRIYNDHLYVAVGSLGSVYVYTLDGSLARTVGYHGTRVGELNFPIDVAVTSDGMTLVLDRRRFNVVCFDQQGVFKGEFGGKGFRLGWFYMPSLLAVDAQDRVYVGQVFKNWVQVCRIPDFITGDGEESQIDQQLGMSYHDVPLGFDRYDAHMKLEGGFGRAEFFSKADLKDTCHFTSEWFAYFDGGLECREH